MKKLMSLLTSALLVTFFSVAPVNALESNVAVNEPIYAACDGASNEVSTDILSCNGRK